MIVSALQSSLLRHLVLSLLSVLAVIAIGTAGYVAIEGWPVFDALYMTVTTVTTVGFQEVHELSRAGRAFTVVLIISGVGTLFYVLSNLARLAIEGELRVLLGHYRVGGRMRALKNHYIICGGGQMGRRIGKELISKALPFVVIEKNPEVAAQLQQDGMVAMEGDATRDEALTQAGVQRAKGLVSVVNSDLENLYIVLTARGLNKDLYIVARAGDEGSERKLLRAGANRVSSPNVSGGMEIAQALIRPAVLDFLELATQSEHLDLQIEEFAIEQGSPLDGKAPHDCGLNHDRGLIIVAVKRQSGHMEFNPGATVRLGVGDRLIVLGAPASLKRLESVLRSGAVSTGSG
ncbi:MAG TPA: potassium channel protein [Nitrospiraceae bacterium]|nr:potassium channel protein [Nitrospiraceae bacterium]